MGGANPKLAGPQSVEIQQPEGAVRRHPEVAGKALVGVWDPSITTVAEAWASSVRKFGTRRCMGTRQMVKKGDQTVAGPYVWRTFNEVNDRVMATASALRALGLPTGAQIGIYAQNQESWMVAEQACYQQSYVSVSIYDTLGADNCQYVVNQAEIPLLFAQASKIKFVLEALPKCPSLKFLVIFGDVSDADRASVEAGGARCMTMSELEAIGKSSPVAPQLPRPADLCTIMYTSGTTGEPKGVMLSHQNVIADVAGAVLGGLNITEEDVHLSYLPMAHIFERVVVNALFAHGSCAGFYQGDPKKVLEDLQELHPTMFVGVPRVFNLLVDRVKKQVEEAGGIKRWMFNKALDAKLAAIPQGLDTPRWNKIVFSKIRDRIVGPRCRRVVSGSAPLSETVQNFLRCIMCCPVVQGYGLTETCAASTLQSDFDPSVRVVGGPLMCCEIKLEDVPEMNYLTTNKPPQGEVLVRGLNVFLGYYKNQAETDKVLEPNGWFHTGDVGQWNANGTLSIIDRRKNIFKLSQGEYIAAEKLEMVYQGCSFVTPGQVWIYGNSEQNCVVVFAVPQLDVIAKWAEQNIGLQGDFNNPEFAKQLCADKRIRQMILEDFWRLGKAARLNSLELPKNIYLDPVPWSIDNDLLTAAFKIKRPQMVKYYREQIEQMYQEVNAAAAAAPAK